MCLFSQPVELVSNTNIFARSANGRQFLVYSMSYAASAELAMVLPLPVLPNSPEDAVSFMNLELYPDFFADMKRGFPPRMVVPRSLGRHVILGLKEEKLVVHEVGSYVASFVPRLADFTRLDEQFRIPEELWHQLPAYRDYGFAVFKLKGTSSGGLAKAVRRLFGRKPKPRDVHPMALTFPRRNADLLYFPTVHVHDRKLPATARFDHMLYCQPGTEMDEYLQDWERSFEPISRYMDIARTKGIVAPDEYCWRRPLEGKLSNVDTWVGKESNYPQLASY
jgi:hypothetical protein